MTNSVFTCDSSVWDELDQFALLACQDYNFGNASDWFGCFRGGIFGMTSRLRAIQRHYFEVHAWLPVPRIFADAEYHLATAFFHMDSAVECMTFALNALGNSVAPGAFRDVTDDRALRRISPIDILGDAGRMPLPGYGTYFPRLQAYLQAHAPLIRQVMEQHDVSKHREMIFHGGKARMDPPPGFFEALGLAPNDENRLIFSPMEEIILDPNPKTPKAGRAPIPADSVLRFEELAQTLGRILSESAPKALADAKATIRLPVSEFRK